MNRAYGVAHSRIKWLAGAHTGGAAVVQNIIARFGMYGINLACGVLTARNLGAAGRGEQGAMMIWPQTLCYLLTLGLPFGLLYQLRSKPEAKDSLVTTSLVIAAGLGTLALVIGVIFIPAWMHQYSRHTIRFAQYIILTAPVVMIGLTVTSILDAAFDFKTGGIVRYVPSALTFLVLVILALSHSFSPETSALAYIVPATLVTIYIWPAVKKRFVFDFSGFVNSARSLLDYGLKVYGAGVLGTIGAQIDQVLVLGFLSAASLGTYSVGLNFSRTVLIIATATSLVVLPKTAGMTTAQVVERVGIAARASLAGSLVIAAMLVASMPLLLPHLYGKDFRGSIHVAQILVLEAILAASITILLQSFLAANRPAFATILQAVGLSLAVPLMFLLVPRWGIMGAAVALLSSTTLRFVFILISYPIVLKHAVPQLILRRSDISEIRTKLRLRGQT